MAGPYTYTLSTPAEQATFLRLNGCPALTQRCTITPVKVGPGKSRSASGKLRTDYQRVALQLQGTSPIMEQQEAYALACLLDARAFHASFDADLYGDRGERTTATNAVFSSSTSKWGAGSVAITGTTGVLEVDGFLGSDQATVAVWRKESGTWHDYLAIFSGGSLSALFKDGAAQSLSTPSWLVVDFSAGSVKLKETAAATTTYFDDLVVMPCAIPEGWVASYVTFRAAQAWPQLPALLAEGNYDPETHLMHGDAKGASAQMGVSQTGAPMDTLRTVDFDLEEE